MTQRSNNKKAAWLLVILTPLIAELALGSTPITFAWLVILWVPVYGAGVLLIRELTVRMGRGWPSLVLLGVAYELLEDGIGLQALTSPHLYDAAQWGLRIFGFNVPYWEANALYHVVFTVLIPIALVDLIFPAHRRRPYLKTRTMTVVVAIVAILGTGILRVSVPPSQDPGYQVPVPLIITFAVLILALGIIALFVLPRRFDLDGSRLAARTSPTNRSLASIGLWWWRLGAGAGVFVGMFLTFPMFNADQPAFTQGRMVIVPLVLALVLAVACGYVLNATYGSPQWSDRHTLAVITGALVAHSLGGIVFFMPDAVNLIGLVVIIVVTILAMIGLDRRLQKRIAHAAAGDHDR
ncbi:hypothetical protein [Brevibacterium zhoupengii]|uniref:hypothetical protein n=1 Tax=Brevibacterium zhoupengii TaxID=2898795 RepID=UPI001E5BBE03|nr:hypothetical protein [Brevibacterium zhoupengii]